MSRDVDQMRFAMWWNEKEQPITTVLVSGFEYSFNTTVFNGLYLIISLWTISS